MSQHGTPFLCMIAFLIGYCVSRIHRGIRHRWINRPMSRRPFDRITLIRPR